jgi:hypothetical protein
MKHATDRARVARRAIADQQSPDRSRRCRSAQRRLLLGLFTEAASVPYFASDVIEVLEGGYSDGQLFLTLLAERRSRSSSLGSPRHKARTLEASVNSPALATRAALSCSPALWYTRERHKNCETLTGQLGVVDDRACAATSAGSSRRLR